MGHARVSVCDVQEAYQRSVPVLVQKHRHEEGLLRCGIASPTSCLGVGEYRVDGPSQGVQYEGGQNGVHPRGYAHGPVTAGRLNGARLVDHGYSGLQPVVQHVAAFPHMAHRYVKVPL